MKKKTHGAIGTVFVILLLLWLQERRRTPISDDAALPRATSFAEAVTEDDNPQVERVIVMATDDTEYIGWSTKYLSNWEHAVYSTSAPPDPYLLPLPNPGLGWSMKGTQALAVLTFIIDYYDSLPKFIAHVKPSRSMLHHGTHFDHQNAIALHSLRFSYVGRLGYANLRCSKQPGCEPAAIQPRRRGKKSLQDDTWQGRMPQSWVELFGPRSKYPGTIAVASGGQFVVAKWQVLKRGKGEYEHFRRWLQQTPMSDRDATETVESLWHVIFGSSPVHCPDEYTCSCEQFNRC